MNSIQSFSTQVGSLSEQKGLKTGRFYRLSDSRWEKGKGNGSRRSLEKSGLPNSLSLTSAKDKQVLALSYQVTDGLVSLTFEREQTGQYRLTKKGEADDRVDEKKESKRTLAAVFVFCFRIVTCDCKHPGAGAGTDTKEDQTLTRFQPKDYKNLVSKEQEIKQFKWTIEAVANLKVRLKQSQQPGTRFGNSCD